MGRHNRDARGEDQRGKTYEISFPPDWMKQIKVTRDLENGRQSTKTLFRNTARPEQPAGSRVRTRITSREQKLDFAIELEDPQGIVTRVIIETQAPNGDPESRLLFSIEDRYAGKGRRAQR